MPRGQYDRTRFKKPMPEQNVHVEGEDFAEIPPPVTPSVSRGTIEPAPSQPIPGVHALDSAPLNSNVTVAQHVPEGKIAWLSTTGEEGRITRLPASDPAMRLPEGAFIRKEGATKYHAMQLGGGTDAPDLFTESASEAIARFMTHFHNAAA